VTPIDEELWFDSEGGDEETEAKAAESMAAMVGRILGAKPFPVAAQRLAELTRAPNARIDQAVRILESDPALSARLLRLVNSAGYALRLRCTSVRHAAALVGTRRLHQVATTAAVLDLFDSKSETAIRVLEHAASVGALSRYLAVHVGLPRDEMFTCGFLHDIGKLMLLDTEGEGYTDLLDACADVPDESHLIERERYGFDHAVLGAHVLAAWNIPEPIPRVVAWHHRPARAYRQGGQIASMVSTVRLADTLSHALLKEATPELIAQIAQSEAASYLEVSEVQLSAMWGELRALREQCQQRSRGAEPQTSLVPRHDLAEVPASRPAPTSSGTPRSLPKHFPCIVCHKPSFGNTCPRCAGYVCSVHQIGPRDFCAQCLREYSDTVAGKPMNARFRIVAGAGIVAVASASVIGVAMSGTGNVLDLALAPFLLTATGTIVSIVAWRWYLRFVFFRARPRHRMPGAEVLREDPPLPAPETLDWASSGVATGSLTPIVARSLAPQSDPEIGIAPTVAVDPELAAALSSLTAARATASLPPESSRGASAFEMAAAVAPMELSAFELAAAMTPSAPPPAENYGPSLIPSPSIPITGAPPDGPTSIEALRPDAVPTFSEPAPMPATLAPDYSDSLPTNFPPVPFRESLRVETLPPDVLQSLPAEAPLAASEPGPAPATEASPAQAPSMEESSAEEASLATPEALSVPQEPEPALSSVVASAAPVEAAALESSAPESATLELGSHLAESELHVSPPKENNSALRGPGQRCQPHRLVYACVSTTPPQLAVVHELSEAEALRVGSAAVA
jgi:putative nucleotidyltransferase with HDIG domain